MDRVNDVVALLHRSLERRRPESQAIDDVDEDPDQEWGGSQGGRHARKEDQELSKH